MKKLINDPFDMVEEMVDGFLSANDDIVKRVGVDPSRGWPARSTAK